VQERAPIASAVRIAVLAVGTRGDVQPYVALGRGLVAAGHDVVIATNANLEGFVREHGVAAAAIAGDSTRWTGWLAGAPARTRPARLLGAMRRRAGELEETLTKNVDTLILPDKNTHMQYFGVV